MLTFLLASIALTLSPGPDNLFILATGLTHGRKPALATALGMCSGITVHTTLAALGISALLLASPLAFTILKFAGAAYLVFLATKILLTKTPARSPSTQLETEYPKLETLPALFRRGFLMNVLNPKVALFFLAFLPQFTNPVSPTPLPLQLLLLGLLFMAQALLLFSTLAYFSGTLAPYLNRHPKITRTLHLATAALLITLALRLAFSHN